MTGKLPKISKKKVDDLRLKPDHGFEPIYVFSEEEERQILLERSKNVEAMKREHDSLMREEQEIRINNFVCPVCDSKEYRAIRAESGAGRIGEQIESIPVGYECCRCSVTFSDPNLFTAVGGE